MKNLTKMVRRMKSNKGQGMVEYILILIVVVAIVMAAKKPLMDFVQNDLMGRLTGAAGQIQ